MIAQKRANVNVAILAGFLNKKAQVLPGHTLFIFVM